MRFRLVLLLALLISDIGSFAQPVVKPTLRDPWRIINGKPTRVRGPEWRGFWGKIIEVQPGGIRIDGCYVAASRNKYYGEFFVANYPYEVADGEYLSEEVFRVAKEVGTYTYTTVLGGSHTIRKLDYFTPCQPPAAPPPTDTDKLAAQIAAERRKEAADIATFNFHKSQAESGNIGSMRRLSELYAAGIGCSQDTNAAARWKSAAASK